MNKLNDIPSWAAYLSICMKVKGWTQQRLAGKIGKSRPTISEWLNGNQIPPLDDYERAIESMGGSFAAYSKFKDKGAV